jgi:hypothetical protein
MRESRMDRRRNETVTEYERHRVKQPPCRWRIADPAALLDHIVVHKKPDPDLWKRVRTLLFELRFRSFHPFLKVKVCILGR